jgi:hypothetical protein
MKINETIKAAERYKSLPESERDTFWQTLRVADAIEVGMLTRIVSGHSCFYLRELAHRWHMVVLKKFKKTHPAMNMSTPGLSQTFRDYETLCERGMGGGFTEKEMKELEKLPPTKAYLEYVTVMKELGLKPEGN